MKQDVIRMEQEPEMTEVLRRFSALSPENQNAAILLIHGILIGEDIALQSVRIHTPDRETAAEKTAR